MRTLGIEINSTKIKMVTLENLFGKLEVIDFKEQNLENPEDRSLTSNELFEMMRQNPIPDRIVVTLPHRYSTFRNLSLPTRNKKAIQAGVNFELEDELPFPAEELLLDYSTLSQNKQGSQVHVAATLNRYVSEIIEFFKESGVDPDLITTEVWAYRQCFQFLKAHMREQVLEQPILLLHMNPEEIVLYTQLKNLPLIFRVIPWGGGKELTSEMTQTLSIPSDSTGLPPSPPDSEDSFLSSEQPPDNPDIFLSSQSKMTKSLTRLIPEILQVSLITQNLVHLPIHQIYLSGESCLIPGIEVWFEQKLNLPVQKFFAFQLLQTTTRAPTTTSEEVNVGYLLPLSLALLPLQKTACINFRKKAFSKGSQANTLSFQKFRQPIVALSIVLLCFGLSIGVQKKVYRSQLLSTGNSLEKAVRSVLGQLGNTTLKNYLATPSTLKTSIQQELVKQRELTRLLAPNNRFSLDFLRAISTAIPRDITVDLIHFQEGAPPSESFMKGTLDHTATLTFLVDNPQATERLQSLFSHRMQNLEKSNPEEMTSTEGTKKWKVTFTGNPNEDLYGK